MADPSDPLDKAHEALSRLKDADDWDEPTGRTEVTVNLKMQSQPDIQMEPKTNSDSDPPLSKAGSIAKDVGILAKLLPRNQRLAFFIGVMLVGSILLALQQGWIRIGPH